MSSNFFQFLSEQTDTDTAKNKTIVASPAWLQSRDNKVLSYRRQTVLQGALVLAKSGRLELGDNILPTL